MRNERKGFGPFGFCGYDVPMTSQNPDTYQVGGTHYMDKLVATIEACEASGAVAAVSVGDANEWTDVQ